MRTGIAVKMAAATVAAVLGACPAAQAYDRGRHPAAALGQAWAGLYIGASVGLGVGDADDIVSAGRNTGDHQFDGPVLGAHVGYNWLTGPFLLGFEASLNGADLQGGAKWDDFNRISTQLNWYGTAVGRFGYVQGTWLIYGFGGAAWGSVDKETRGDNGEGAVLSLDVAGWTAGFGAEYALNPRWSIRAEYSHVDFGSHAVQFAPGFPARTDLTLDTFRIGASYKLFGH
jgi:opacity protein-like surface antigen